MALLRPESEMKDSGIEWIGSIPQKWGIIKNKYLLHGMYSGGTPKAADDTFYVEDGIPFVSISDMSTTDYVYETKKHLSEAGLKDKNLKVLDEGTILYSIYATIGAVSELRIKATISQAMLALSLQDGYHKDYYKYNLQAMRDSVFALSNGNTQFNLNAEKVWNFTFVNPPLSEQKAMAEYLDDCCSKIDEIIAEATASIEEYKELKQAVIFEAVTRGLDKNVPMKDSGIEWIREIPSTWNVTRIKYLLCEINNRSETGEEEPLSVSQVLGVVPSTMIAVANPASSTIGQKIVEPGDLVFNKLKAHLGVFFVSDYKGLVSPDYAVYRANDKVNPKFLEYLFHTPACITEFKKYITGVAVGLMRLYTSDLFNISIALPKRREQERIIEYLADNVSKYDALISEKQSLIEDLKAYKKSLIYEVVTGKRRIS